LDLLLAEKPSSAKAIARALGNAQRKLYNRKTPYYIVDNDKFVCSAVGHLFTLYPKNDERGIFPKFDFQFISIWSVDRKAYYAKNFFDCLKFITSQYNFDRYIIATDYDPEGTVIGFITYIALKVPLEKLYRMKMNSLARDEVLRAYNNLEPPDYSWFRAGLARHEVDIIYGVNLTEAFSTAVERVRGRRRTISLGRVQTPTLKFVVDREREIRNFIPKPYWNVLLSFDFQEITYTAKHVEGDIFSRDRVEEILNSCKGFTSAVVESFKKGIKEIPAPTLFNQSTLQQEAFYKLGMSPDVTDKVAQSLYQQALISYPRTGSTAIWTGVPYKKVLDSLSKEAEYFAYVNEIIEKNYQPHKRGISDGAHSAIYPTGEPYKPKTQLEMKLLDLIKRRFISVFYPPLKREHSKLVLNVNGERFKLLGVRTIDEGWLEPYAYKKVEERIIPELQPGTTLPIKSITVEEKQTAPPGRYTSASLVKMMEKQGIGTKATRAEIVKTLWCRRYIVCEKNVGLKPTPLGEKLIEISEKFVPLIIDVKLTRELERDLENIMNGVVEKDMVVEKARNNIMQILNHVSENLISIGEELNSVI